MPKVIRDFINCLKMIPGVELPPALPELLVRESRRLPSESLDEFLSLILLECLETCKTRSSIDVREITRIIWRIRKRMSRQLLHEKEIDARILNTFQSRPDVRTKPDRLVRDREELQNLLSRLTSEEILILELILDGWSQREIAAKIGRSEATVSRLRSGIRQKIRR